MLQTSNMDFGGVARIGGLPPSTSSGEPVVHEQLAAAIEGLAWKDDARVYTTANVDLSTPGSTIDGVTMVAGDRFVRNDSSTQPLNGIYVWNGASVPATRSLDASSSSELRQAVVTIAEGTSAGLSFRQSATIATLGTSPIVFSAFATGAGAASEAASGIAEIASQAEVDAGTDDARIITPLKLKSASFLAKGYAANFGDGSALSYVFTHNLNSQDVIIQVRRATAPFDVVGVDAAMTTVNTATISGFTVAPTTNQYRVLISRVGI